MSQALAYKMLRWKIMKLFARKVVMVAHKRGCLQEVLTMWV